MVAPTEAAPSSGSSESVVVIDDAGVIVKFDDSAVLTFGYSADEVIGEDVRLLMPEPFRSEHDRYISDYLRTGSAHIIGIGRNVTAIRKDGSEFPARLSVVDIEIDGTRRFVGILRDITAQVAADTESQARRVALDAASKTMHELAGHQAAADMRYRLMADNAVDVVAHLRGTQIVWISPSVEAAFGDPPEQWIGKDFTPRIHPDDRAAVAAALQKVAKRDPAGLRCRVSGALGYRWVEARGKPFNDAEGNNDGMIFALRIIDDQVQVERQLAADRERFEAVVENSPSAISVRDLQHRYIMVNAAFCALFGEDSAEDVIGRTEDEILPADVLERSRHGAGRLLADENFIEEESIARGPEKITVMTQRFALRDAAGETSELVTIRTDITHRKKIEHDTAERAHWAKRISAAIADGRLLVYAQPIVDIKTRETVEDELLVRLRAAESGEILPPSEFLPQCEEHGLMPVIDRYMVGRAIDLAATGRHVCVNIAGQTIGDPAAMGGVFQALATAGPEVADKILFEITETTALASPDKAKTFSARMRSLGCRVALDDFGTGYGTFTELRHLDLDSLKIDLSFVQNMLENAGDERAVNTILLVARIYGLTTVAEGVETEATLQKLAAMGADRAQGYLFAKPAPVVWQ